MQYICDIECHDSCIQIIAINKIVKINYGVLDIVQQNISI